MTKEKNDMTNEHNFKVGDRVAADDAEYSGIVTEVRGLVCKVRFDDGEELFFLNDALHHSDLPDYDHRTAFLTRLQSLLREFDASLVCLYHNFAQDHYPCVVFKDGEILWWSHYLNTMDFDKE